MYRESVNYPSDSVEHFTLEDVFFLYSWAKNHATKSLYNMCKDLRQLINPVKLQYDQTYKITEDVSMGHSLPLLFHLCHCRSKAGL